MAVRIERLGGHHQRAGFDCGEPSLNDFLLRQSGQLSRRGFGKTYVSLAEGDLKVTGYVTLSAGQVSTAMLPATLKLPRHPAPVLRIARLGVDRSMQGQGLGLQLMSFSLQLALEFAEQVGVYAVLVDAKNDKAKAFYAALGFTATLDDPLCLYLPITTLQMLGGRKP